MSSGPLYLGFDLSTQQLKAIVVQSDLTVVSEAKVDFDADFGKQYGLRKGVLTNEAEGEVYAPVAMFLEAIDLVLSRLSAKTPMDRIKGISGSCQQHGSTYWGQEAETLLGGLPQSDKPLVEQLKEAFSFPYAPNWQDHSTQAQCDEFDANFETAQRLAEVTGSAAHHRFTGTQIMRLRQKRPEMYAATSRISLVSSFLASVLLGSVAPIDISDVCGMNLWDISAGNWSEPLLELTAGSKSGVSDLRAKLGEPRHDGGGSMGAISGYFVRRYGFSAECQVAPFTGDNPATILALPLRPMDAIVSLGTSSTFLMVTPVYKPDAAYHFFNHPCTPGQYMFMLCYKNGGLARESVRDALPKPEGGDPWANFNKAVLDTPPLDVRSEKDDAKLGLYFDLPEIVPNIKAGTWRYTAKQDGSALTEASEPWSKETDARIIVESQALSMRLRSQNLVHSPESDSKVPAQPRRIYLVGGGSLNPAIARVMGDVLGGAEGVYKLDVGGNACALGGAYKAVWALERGEGETFDELIGKRWKEEGAIQKVDGGYKEGVFEGYQPVVGAFEEMEKRILKVAHN
ncbi:D-xylulose kinase [Colletotrichum fioriniae PJ7]|uniref:Xylulose kinase n=1 Tax=Colletotrichum fioriniae PJ7 TaxID=1445577 RepID=A0A010Q0X2_9PEZI|nr:D-xylulose kinase [Colletotrichum fioriniae PJ7]